MATVLDVAARLGQLAKFYGRAFDDAEVLVFFAETVCSKISPNQALKAISKWATEKPKFPVPADLIREVIPETTVRDEANEVASAMLGAISRQGYNWPQKFHYDGHATFEDALREELGESAIAIVERAGGWPAFCQSFDPVANPNSRPQLRDLVESRSKRLAAREHAALESGHDEKRLSGMGTARDTVGEYLEGLKKKTPVV